MKRILFSAAGGLLFGLAVAAVNTALLRRALRSGKNLPGAMAVRMLLDVAALGAVYLLRSVLPMHFESAIIAAAAGLSGGIIAMTYLLSRREKREPGQPEVKDHA